MSKKMKIMLPIILIFVVVLIVVGVVLIKQIPNDSDTDNDNYVDNFEKTLSNIDSIELQKNIIRNLEKTKLNVNYKSGSTEIKTMFQETTKFRGVTSAVIIKYENGKKTGKVEIPCFKINSYKNGKFKNIEYTYDFMNSNIISEAVKETFKTEYGIDDISEVLGSEKYRKFVEDGTQGVIYYSKDEFFIQVTKEICGIDKMNDSLKESMEKYSTVILGNISENESQSYNENELANNTEIIFRAGKKYINKYGFITDYADSSAIEIKGIDLEDNQEKISGVLFQNLDELYYSLEENDLLKLVNLIDISNQYDIIIYMNLVGKVVKFGNFLDIDTKCLYIKKISEIEKECAGEIVVNVDFSSGGKPFFREPIT